jgi:hypothetical protein
MENTPKYDQGSDTMHFIYNFCKRNSYIKTAQEVQKNIVKIQGNINNDTKGVGADGKADGKSYNR